MLHGFDILTLDNFARFYNHNLFSDQGILDTFGVFKNLEIYD